MFAKSLLPSHHRPADETWLHRIVQMIAERCTSAEILGALCRPCGTGDVERQLAIYTMEGEAWGLAAHGDLSPRSAASMARIQPEELSATLMRLDPGQMIPIQGGWATHLMSSAGELMGLLVSLASDGPPCRPEDTVRIESICRLASMVLDQQNLFSELEFKIRKASLRTPVTSACDTEILMQSVAQKIGQHCPPQEILEALLPHISLIQSERQIAFFLTDGETWTLAARGDLTARSNAILENVAPACLSDSLFDCGSSTSAPGPFAGPTGWARHVYSGTGELLGMIVGLAESLALPSGHYETRIESICRLATLSMEQNNLIQELAFKADHDSLTGLFNRNHYQHVLGWMLRPEQQMNQGTALLYVNLDRFRLINDVLGASIGNFVLAEASQRFRICVREEDLLARVGGDEFAAVISGLQCPEEADEIASRLLLSLSIPFRIDDNDLFINASIGIAFSKGGSTVEKLEREARIALYQSKHDGKARFTHFHSSFAATPPERLEMEKQLRFALARGELLVHYQPQVDFSSRAVVGAEALLRWRPDGLGIVSPANFVPILEQTGMIVEFGRWVLRESCRQWREWADKYGFRHRLAVNVSSAQITQPGFVGDVEAILAETGMPPDLLELELTESLMVGNFESASRVFKTLLTTGIRFAVDDFGTGQSSLAYLHKLPFQTLKIDIAFVRRLAAVDSSLAIVRNIIQMADSLEMSTVAEGVETFAQAKILCSLGCDLGQGYLFAPPLPPDEFVEFCRSHRIDGGIFEAGTSFESSSISHC